MPPDPQNEMLVAGFRASVGSGPFDLGGLRRGASPAWSESTVRLVERFEDRSIDGPAGPIPVRIYWPRQSKPLGVLVYFHGGGFVAGGLDTVDGVCRTLVDGANCIAVSVDYRLAPEHKFPAGVEDAYAAFLWATRNAEALGAPTRVAVGGDSAGGNFAAVVSLMARDRAEPSPVFQLLIYPGINLTLDTPERAELARAGYLLTPELIDWLNGFYCERESDFLNPYCAPVHADDLTGLPAALVIVGEYDPLRFECETYDDRLRGAGVAVTYSLYAGSVHGFITAFEFIDSGRAALAECAAALRTALGTPVALRS
jgi:acetyl esterase